MINIICNITNLFKKKSNTNIVGFIELNANIWNFISYEYSHSESFQEIKELLFTNEKLQKNYSILEIFNLMIVYQKTKYTMLNKIKNSQYLTFIEAFLVERLLMKFNNSKYLSVEEHLDLLNKELKMKQEQ